MSSGSVVPRYTSLITKAYSLPYSFRVPYPASLHVCGPSLHSRQSQPVSVSAADRGRRLARQQRSVCSNHCCVLHTARHHLSVLHHLQERRETEGLRMEDQHRRLAQSSPVLSSECGPTVSLPYNAAPTEFFSQVYPPELIDLIVEKTNLYAVQRVVAGWLDAMATEIQAFLGFAISTSLHRVPRLNNIWLSDWVLGVPALVKIFPRHHCWQLWANLLLADNTQAPGLSEPSFDWLYKLWPMLNILFSGSTSHRNSCRWMRPWCVTREGHP